MKLTIFVLTVSLVFLFDMVGSSQSYSLTVTNEPYDSLKNGISAVKGSWSDPAFIIPIGFTFHFFDEDVDSLYSLEFFAGGYVGTNPDISAMNIIIPISSDLIDRGYEIDSSLSPILYKTQGVAGHRIFTLEYKNAGFWSGEINNEIYTDYINVQLKLYEENNSISVHIGPYSTANAALDFEGFSGPTIGLVQGFDFINEAISGEIFILAEDPLDPTIITDLTPLNMVWPIAENTLYTFGPIPTDVEKIRSQSSTEYYYPNPSSALLYLHHDVEDGIISSIKVLNSMGAVVLTENNQEVIDMGNLPNGVYELSFQTKTGNVVQRVLKIR